MKASTFCQPALTCYETQGQYVEDITRWREDMNMSCKNNILRTTNVTIFLLYDRSRNKPKTKKAAKQVGVILRENTCFPCVTYFFTPSLVKYGKYECFSLR